MKPAVRAVAAAAILVIIACVLRGKPKRGGITPKRHQDSQLTKCRADQQQSSR